MSVRRSLGWGELKGVRRSEKPIQVVFQPESNAPFLTYPNGIVQLLLEEKQIVLLCLVGVIYIPHYHGQGVEKSRKELFLSVEEVCEVGIVKIHFCLRDCGREVEHGIDPKRDKQNRDENLLENEW